MLTICTSCGKIAVTKEREAGYTGPNTRPMTLAKKALPIFEFTNQMSSSIIRPIAVGCLSILALGNREGVRAHSKKYEPAISAV